MDTITINKNSMIKPTYKHLQFFLCFLLGSLIFSSISYGQAKIQVRVASVEVTNNVDCDGLFTSDSDFVFEYIATDNTLGNSNNNPVLFGFLGDFNHAYRNNNNGPWTLNAPNGNINPNNGIFYDHDFVCPTDVPSTISIDWQGYENDDPIFNYDLTSLFSEVRTGGQTGNIAVPAAPGTNTQVLQANGTSGCGTQTYRITLEVTRTALSITPVEDNICNAIQLPVNNVAQQFGWCGNQTLEPGEPLLGNLNAHGSAWFNFTCPASGQVTIETDLGGTDFGTELVIYHAADGAACVQGNNNWAFYTGAPANPIKSKFDYLSYQGDADDDIFIIDPNAKATAHFGDVTNVFPAIRDGHALLAGETYYIQVTTDQNNRRGYFSIRVEDIGGSPFEPHDIPCQGIDVSADAQSTTVRTEAGGQAFSTQLFRGTFFGGSVVSDEEIGPPYFGTDATQFKAYNYVPTQANGLDGSMWVQFVAANSGRIYFEADIDNALLNESENNALYAPDPRFAPGTPADLFCSNIQQIADAEGGSGGILGGNNTAIIIEQCLEPGYTYYGMVDPAAATTADEAEVWVYDPSSSDPALNPPPNDILCLAMADSLFEVPVKPANQTIPFSAVAGNNSNACIETLAGEPFSSPSTATRADQTVWHYFVVPPSGVVEMKLRAYIGMDSLNYAVYPLFQDSLCYGGLLPATFTQDGTQATDQVSAIASGTTNFNGDIVGLCCLNPGEVLAIQIDGGHPGDVGQYIIEYINEIEVYAGDAQFTINNLDTFNYLGPDTGYVCFGDTLFPGVMLDLLGNSTTSIANCLDIGYVIQDSLNIPDSIINGNFIFTDSVYLQPQYWVNDGSHPFSNNAVHYVSPMADEQSIWGTLTCPSASAENGAAFVFLQAIVLNPIYNSTTCIIDWSATGGFPAYNGSLFDFVITNQAGDTVSQGQSANGFVNQYQLVQADTFTIVVSDGARCNVTAIVDATPCTDPCINNPVFVTPDPIDSTVYTCFPGGDSALVTIFLNGGEPTVTVGQAYTSIVSGSTAPNANGSFNTVGSGAPAATAFSFTVLDTDNWSVVVNDVNGCADTVSGTFDYNLMNCPDYCTLNPIVSSYNYNCNMDGSAIVEVTIGGGAPAIDGSNYTVNISGSTIFGQNFQNAQLTGVVGGTTGFSFIVNSGDSWSFDVFDINMCTDTLQDVYTFDTSNCPICAMMPVEFFPDPIDSTVYTCAPNGEATVTLFVTGGAPSFNTSLFTLNTSGSSVAGQNGSNQEDVGLYTFNVADGDNWQVIATDSNSCADTASGNFLYNPYNLDVFAMPYVCYVDKSADITIRMSGGLPANDGSNYLVTIIGSTTPGVSAYQVPVAGTIADTTDYTFNVQDGDSWLVVITDNSSCGVDSISGTFLWNPSNCGNICNDTAYVGVAINGGSGTFSYLCDTLGNGLLSLQLSGGLPELTGGNDDYLAYVTVNGVQSSYLVNSNGSIATFDLNLSDGDSWSVDITDALQCDTASLSATFTSVNAVANAVTPPNMLLGQIATLDGSSSTGNIISYAWTPPTTVSNPTAVTSTVQPMMSTYYTLAVSDSLGCQDSDSVWVEVGRCVPFHAGFTPNGDAVNDFWEIPCLDLFTNRVQVFNRWGQIVFEAENYDGTWDGTNLGQDVPDATYYYVISVDNPLYNRPVIYKGTVSIIR